MPLKGSRIVFHSHHFSGANSLLNFGGVVVSFLVIEEAITLASYESIVYPPATVLLNQGRAMPSAQDLQGVVDVGFLAAEIQNSYNEGKGPKPSHIFVRYVEDKNCKKNIVLCPEISQIKHF